MPISLVLAVTWIEPEIGLHLDVLSAYCIFACVCVCAFDLSITKGGKPFLINWRVFAMPGTGIPDGIKLDMDGNVYAGCGDGINVWSPGGILLGKILIKNGTSNFSFGRNDRMFILNENKLWAAQLSRRLRGSLLGI